MPTIITMRIMMALLAPRHLPLLKKHNSRENNRNGNKSWTNIAQKFESIARLKLEAAAGLTPVDALGAAFDEFKAMFGAVVQAPDDPELTMAGDLDSSLGAAAGSGGTGTGWEARALRLGLRPTQPE